VIDVREAITHAHHAEWARVVASLTRRFGDLDIAEDAAAEAFATAVQRWPAYGVPPNPGAWLTTTANRKAIDRIRRENKRDDKQKEAQLLYGDDAREPLDAIDDERLRLIFTCCHPALAMETRVALTLRMVAGLTVPEIARAFLVQESTMGSGSPARRPRSRRLASLIECRPRRISRHASPVYSPSSSSSSTRATWRPAQTPIPYVTT
jgi:RNA polymerase sigma-70 factor (ECF subfamily)